MTVYSLADPVETQPESGFTPWMSPERQIPPRTRSDLRPESSTVTYEYFIGSIFSVFYRPRTRTVPGGPSLQPSRRARRLFGGRPSLGGVGRRNIDNFNVEGDWDVFLGPDINLSGRGNFTRLVISPG